MCGGALPIWSALAALLSTMAPLRKTTCKEKNILQSWWPELTHILVRFPQPRLQSL